MSTTTDTTPSTHTTENTSDLIDRHLQAYGEPDPARRAALAATVWAPESHLADPPFEGRGIDGIAALTDLVLGHYPGHTFRRSTLVDEHHGVARYGWELVAPDGTVAVAGTDIADVVDGRLVRVIGFFGDTQPLAS